MAFWIPACAGMTGGQTIMFSIAVEADDEPEFASNAAIDNIDEERTVVAHTVTLPGVASSTQGNGTLTYSLSPTPS